MLTPEYYNTSPVFVYRFDGFDKMISPSGLLSGDYLSYFAPIIWAWIHRLHFQGS